MKNLSHALLAMFIVFILGMQAHASFILPDPTSNAMLYGDFYSYSLPILAYQYDQMYGGGEGPGNPYYVKSTPGEIKDLVVIATGASGNPVNTNFTGMDNAYPTPNASGVPTFSTGTTPDPSPTFTGDQINTWDTQLSSLTSFLGGDDLIVFFNNNQINSGDAENQNLYAWALVEIRDSSGVADPFYFEFTNTLLNPDPEVWGGIFGGDPTLFDSDGTAPALPGVGDIRDDRYVLSGGQVCINTVTGFPVDCDSTDPNDNVSAPFNHNLGADQAAYALSAPELNLFLQQWDPINSPYDVMSVDIRMTDLNNGYEQIFISSAAAVPHTPIPEPGTLILLGAGLLGLATVNRKRFTKKQ